MAINDGGPAFPEAVAADLDGGLNFSRHTGMSLRDYFAGQALAALLSQMTYGNQGQRCAMYDPNDPGQAITLAHLSYQAADAMLKAERR